MKRIIFSLIACVVMFMTVPAFAEEAETITMEDLILMDGNERNTVLNVIEKVKKQKLEASKKAAESAIVENVVAMDVETLDAFKDKASSIADIIIVFCEKLGVTVNEFITTPAGNFIIFGVLYKLGVFGSVWWFIKGSVFLILFVWLLWALNTKKKIKLVEEITDAEGKVTQTHTTEEIVPRFSAIFGDNDGEKTAYSVVVSVIILLCVIFMVW